MRRFRELWNVVRWLAIATPALAQQEDTAVFRVGEVVVQATRPVTTTGGASALEVRVDSIRLNAAPTLEQLLRALPLVQVRTNSRGEAQFSLRGSGSDARQVAVLVDGVPLSLGWDDRADLSVLPTTAAQTITLSRGLPSLLYGPNVLGGVVEVGVARGATAALNPRSLQVDAGGDHTGALGVSAALTLPVTFRSGDLLLRGGGGHRTRDGIPLPDDVAEPIPADDPDLRLNTDLEHSDVFMALRYQSRRGAWAALTTAGSRAERGIPAELHITGARFWRYPDQGRLLAVISGGTGEQRSPLGGVGDVEMSIGLDAAHTEIDQYDTRAYETIVANENADDRNITVRLRADQTVTSSAELRTAVTYADINHDEVLDPGTAATYRQRLWSVAAEASIRPGGLRRTRVSVGLAYDRADTPESGDKPPLEALHEWGARAGFTSIASGGRLLWHGGVSRRVRFPSLRELYSGALGRFEPNPRLGPERLIAGEVGATIRIGRGDVQAVAFHHALADAIVRVAAADHKFQRVNRDHQRTTGLELLAGTEAGRLRLGAELTLQDTRLEEDAGIDSEAEYQPDILAGFNATMALPADVRFDARARYVGSQSCLNPETNLRSSIAASTRFDAEAARAWSVRAGWVSRVELAAAVDNLSDTTIYDQCGLPQPGRTVRVQLRLR